MPFNDWRKLAKPEESSSREVRKEREETTTTHSINVRNPYSKKGAQLIAAISARGNSARRIGQQPSAAGKPVVLVPADYLA